MIRFVCNNNQFEKELRLIMDFEIDYLSSKEGVLYIDDKDKEAFDLFCVEINQAQGIIITGLECYAQDGLTSSALFFAHQLQSSKIHRLSTVLLVALIVNHEPLKQEMINWVKKLKPAQVEFAKVYIHNGGNALRSAQQLFVHRNTINNRLNEFELQTKMDLRYPENLKVLDLLLTFQTYG